MSQQNMDYSEMHRDSSDPAYRGYEETHRHNMYGDGVRLSRSTMGTSLTAGQRLFLAIASLIMFMIMTFGLIGIAIAIHAANWSVFPILFILILFTAAIIIINVVFNRKS